MDFKKRKPANPLQMSVTLTGEHAKWMRKFIADTGEKPTEILREALTLWAATHTAKEK